MNDTVKEINDYLKEHQMFPEVSQHPKTLDIEIFVDWGDWKHDHIYLDYLMKEFNYVKLDEEVTDEDGSDTYSSIHYYEKKKLTNKLQHN